MRYTIQDLTIGQMVRSTDMITKERVRQYAEVTGDCNPVHLDEVYASKTRYGSCIAHGMLLGGFISRLIGMKLPGEGTIYAKQELSFTAPVYIGDAITTEICITAMDHERNRVTISTICRNQANLVVAQGTAEVLPAK